MNPSSIVIITAPIVSEPLPTFFYSNFFSFFGVTISDSKNVRLLDSAYLNAPIPAKKLTCLKSDLKFTPVDESSQAYDCISLLSVLCTLLMDS